MIVTYRGRLIASLILMDVVAMLAYRAVFAASSTPVNSTVNVASGSTGGVLFDVTATFENITAGSNYTTQNQLLAWNNNSSLQQVVNGNYGTDGSGAFCVGTPSNPGGTGTTCSNPRSFNRTIQAKGKGGGNALQYFYPAGFTWNALVPAGYGGSPGENWTIWAGTNDTRADVINMSVDIQWAPGWGWPNPATCNTAGNKFAPQLGYYPNTGLPGSPGTSGTNNLSTFSLRTSNPTSPGLTNALFSTINTAPNGGITTVAGSPPLINTGTWANYKVQFARGPSTAGNNATTGYVRYWQDGALQGSTQTVDGNGAAFNIPESWVPVFYISSWLGGNNCNATSVDSFFLMDNIRYWTGTGP